MIAIVHSCIQFSSFLLVDSHHASSLCPNMSYTSSFSRFPIFQCPLSRPLPPGRGPLPAARQRAARPFAVALPGGPWMVVILLATCFGMELAHTTRCKTAVFKHTNDKSTLAGDHKPKTHISIVNPNIVANLKENTTHLSHVFWFFIVWENSKLHLLWKLLLKLKTFLVIHATD